MFLKISRADDLGARNIPIAHTNSLILKNDYAYLHRQYEAQYVTNGINTVEF